MKVAAIILLGIILGIILGVITVVSSHADPVQFRTDQYIPPMIPMPTPVIITGCLK